MFSLRYQYVQPAVLNILVLMYICPLLQNPLGQAQDHEDYYSDDPSLGHYNVHTTKANNSSTQRDSYVSFMTTID